MTATDRNGDRLRLVTVHAHPDDEASKGAGTVARYTDEGVRAALVRCTGGEEGEILNPAADSPEARADLAAVRIAELEESVAILGYEALYWLGYRDSGMEGSEANTRPDNFANAPLDEAVERLVTILRQERPQVLVTYGEQRNYRHPDHVRVHEISVLAFDAAGDPDRYPGAGTPWQPLKLYYVGFSPERITALHELYLSRGEESPYQRWFDGDPELFLSTPPSTTYVDVSDYLHRRRAALAAHRTQVDPDGHWMRLPDEDHRAVFPWEDYELARTLVDNGIGPGEREHDLFAGIRAYVPSEG